MRGLSPADVDAVEAHGTGTTLGDPIEAQALLATYGQDRAADRPLWLGSVKSNIGHTQAAAGVAGVIKMVHGAAARRAAADPARRRAVAARRLVGGRGRAADRGPRRGRTADRPRRAGVSSFGISGTNAHVILEQAPPSGADARCPDGRDRAGAVPWVLSGADEPALRGQAERLARRPLTDRPELAPPDVGLSLATTRVGARAPGGGARRGPRTTLVDGLDALAAGRAARRCRGAPAARPRQLALLFTGQGASGWAWAGSCTSGSRCSRRRSTRCARASTGELDRPLRDVVFGERRRELLDQTGYTQPALFAVEVALFRLVESWGVRPDCAGGAFDR